MNNHLDEDHREYHLEKEKKEGKWKDNQEKDDQIIEEDQQRGQLEKGLEENNCSTLEDGVHTSPR